jgi:hypothetical protein
MHKLSLALKRILKDFNPAESFSRGGLWNAGFLPTEYFKIPMGWFLA